MKKPLLLFWSLIFIISCTNREELVDKDKLTGRDYRLFQGTPSWELAKAVQDSDESKVVEILAKKPSLIDCQEPKYGNTLLMLTVMNQQMKPFKLLLDNNADVNIHNTYDGTSAIIEASRTKFYDIKYVEILLLKGANVNDIEIGKRREGNSTRFAPLMAASRSGRLDIVKLLVAKGADINYRNEFNQSALSASIMQEEYEVAYYLLQNGADYKQPIFYRPDYSVPSELQDPNDKGEPMYLVDVLREDFSEFDTNEYKFKIQIVDFLLSKGIDYRAAPIPEYIKKKAKEVYPNRWREYLEKY